MSHQPYEDMIFSEERLTDVESQNLREHLRNCESCEKLTIAWREVATDLQRVTMVEPEPHFVNRWQARLEVDRLQSQGKQNRVMMIITWGAVFAAFAILVYLAWPMLQSPKVYVLTYLSQLIGWLSVANYVQGISSTLSNGVYGGISYIWLVLAFGILTEIGVLWIVSIRYLTNPRKVTI